MTELGHPNSFRKLNNGGGIYGLGSPLAEFDDLTRAAAKK